MEKLHIHPIRAAPPKTIVKRAPKRTNDVIMKAHSETGVKNKEAFWTECEA
jgi:hypothetical protein